MDRQAGSTPAARAATMLRAPAATNTPGSTPTWSSLGIVGALGFAQQRQARGRGGQAERAGDGRQHEAFEQQQPHQAAAGGPECNPHRQLPLSSGGPAEQQSRDAARGHQQQEQVPPPP